MRPMAIGLLEQFINGELNTRDDAYGGALIENRLRFVLEVTDAVSRAIGSEKTGNQLAAKLGEHVLACVHLGDQKTLGQQAIPDGFVEKLRAADDGQYLLFCR